MKKTIKLMYYTGRHSTQQVLDRVTDPFLMEVMGYDNSHDFYKDRELGWITHNGLDSVDINIGKVKNIGSKVRRFADRHSFNIEQLAPDAYFLKSLRRAR